MTAPSDEAGAPRPRVWLPDRFPEDAEDPFANVGCGTDVREGWINADMDPTGTLDVDVRFNIVDVPWPFEADALGLVYMRHVLEHVPHTVPGHDTDGFLLLMAELHRVLKPGGYAYFRTPHWESTDIIRDPTHTRAVHPHNFRYLDPSYKYGFYTDTPFRLVEAYPSSYAVRGGIPPRIGDSGLTIAQHLWERAPILRPLLQGAPTEMTYVLQKLPEA